MKCRYCEQLMYSVEINLRIGTHTTKKPIGQICPIDDGYWEFNNFWKKFSEEKQKNLVRKQNEIGYKKKPRIRPKLPCGECFSYNVTVRKIKNEDRYRGKCNDCQFIWFQGHSQ